LNSNGAGKEKRARRVATRPKPTIYGNCDSWSFIVGKKPRAYRQSERATSSLQTSNMDFINKLSTSLKTGSEDNMWAACGSDVNPGRIVPSRALV
jgi:hypothetical protein